MQHFFICQRICAKFILFLRVKLFFLLGVCDQWTLRDIIVLFPLDIREPDFAANFYSDLVGFLYGQKHR